MENGSLKKLLGAEINCFAIEWCIDDDGEGVKPELPAEVCVPVRKLVDAGLDVDSVDWDDIASDDALGDALVEYLSDTYGFLIHGLRYDVKPADSATGSDSGAAPAKKVRFNVYFEMVGRVEMELPDDIDVSDTDAVLDFIEENWDSVSLPTDAEYVSDSCQFDREAPIEIGGVLF